MKFTGVKVKEVIAALEQFAPLPLQEGYDNAGLQVGLTEAEVSGALLCLDITESVLQEAVQKGCNLVVAHHPLVFRPLRHITDDTYVERCVRYAVKNDIAIYAAHTNLDNAQGGVSFEMAKRLGLTGVTVLQQTQDGNGSGVVGTLPTPMTSSDFVSFVKQVFGVKCVMANQLLTRQISKVALCGGAGDFLLSEAVAQKADAFITGEMHYHSYFGLEQQIQIAIIGHYQSERYTPNLMQQIIESAFPALPVQITTIDTNPIEYI